MSRGTLNIDIFDEFRIEPKQREAIRVLLAASFSGAEFTESRTYLKQIPSRRFLAMEGDVLVGHAALDHRVVGSTQGPVEVFGIVDVLCLEGTPWPRNRDAPT